MELDTPDPLAEASARSLDNERRTIAGKAAVVALAAAVLRADPAELPPGVRSARERVERLTIAEGAA